MPVAPRTPQATRGGRARGRGRGPHSPTTTRRSNPYPPTSPNVRRSSRILRQAAAAPAPAPVVIDLTRDGDVEPAHVDAYMSYTSDSSDGEDSGEDEVVDQATLAATRERQEREEREREEARRRALEEQREEEEHWRRMRLELGDEYLDLLPPVPGSSMFEAPQGLDELLPPAPAVRPFVAHSRFNAGAIEEPVTDSDEELAEDVGRPTTDAESGEEVAEEEEDVGDEPEMELDDIVDEILHGHEMNAAGGTRWNEHLGSYAFDDDYPADFPTGPTEEEMRGLYEHETMLMSVLIPPTYLSEEALAMQQSSDCADVNSIFASDPGYQAHRMNRLVEGCHNNPKAFNHLMEKLTGMPHSNLGTQLYDGEYAETADGQYSEVEDIVKGGADSDVDADDEAEDPNDEDYGVTKKTTVRTFRRRASRPSLENTQPSSSRRSQGRRPARQAAGLHHVHDENCDCEERATSKKANRPWKGGEGWHPSPVRKVVIDGSIPCKIQGCREHFDTSLDDINEIGLHIRQHHPATLESDTDFIKCPWPGCSEPYKAPRGNLAERARVVARHLLSKHLQYRVFVCPNCEHKAARDDAVKRHIANTCFILNPGPSADEQTHGRS